MHPAGEHAAQGGAPQPAEGAADDRALPHPRRLVPPTRILSFREALARVSPPPEDDVTCYVCSTPAVALKHKIAWCKTCVMAVFPPLGLTVLGETSRAVTPLHATNVCMLALACEAEK